MTEQLAVHRGDRARNDAASHPGDEQRSRSASAAASARRHFCRENSTLIPCLNGVSEVYTPAPRRIGMTWKSAVARAGARRRRARRDGAARACASRSNLDAHRHDQGRQRRRAAGRDGQRLEPRRRSAACRPASPIPRASTASRRSIRESTRWKRRCPDSRTVQQAGITLALGTTDDDRRHDAGRDRSPRPSRSSAKRRSSTSRAPRRTRS